MLIGSFNILGILLDMKSCFQSGDLTKMAQLNEDFTSALAFPKHFSVKNLKDVSSAMNIIQVCM